MVRSVSIQQVHAYIIMGSHFRALLRDCGVYTSFHSGRVLRHSANNKAIPMRLPLRNLSFWLYYFDQRYKLAYHNLNCRKQHDQNNNTVFFKKLSSRPELNGKQGVVQHKAEKAERWIVQAQQTNELLSTIWNADGSFLH